MNKNEMKRFHDASTLKYGNGASVAPNLEKMSSQFLFTFNILLIYDCDADFYYAQELIELLQPQNLRIFDFAKDSPPGVSQREVIASALKACRYTCIIVTRHFLTNFWLKFKTDMAIQDMLNNERKRYSVVVVVMDPVLKLRDLPLELEILSPLFRSSKYFQHRLQKAFVDAPFHPGSFFEPMEPVQVMAPSSSCNRVTSSPSTQSRKVDSYSPSYHVFDTPDYSHAASGAMKTTCVEGQHQGNSKPAELKRQPTEHSVNATDDVATCGVIPSREPQVHGRSNWRNQRGASPCCDHTSLRDAGGSMVTSSRGEMKSHGTSSTRRASSRLRWQVPSTQSDSSVGWLLVI